MAGYDFFTQPQGPAISPSLFPDAASAGIRAGNALPTATTAIIQGAIEGIKTGQQINANYQAEQINQHTIDQFPVQDAIQAENLKQEQFQTQVAEVTAKISTLDTDSQIKIQQQKLKNELASAEQTNADITAKKEISELATTPQGAADIFSNPKYTDYLSRNPDTASNILGRASGILEADKVNAIARQINFWKEREYEAARREEDRKYNQALDKSAKEDYETLTNGHFAWLMNTKGLSYPEMLKRVTTKPSGDSSTEWRFELDNQPLLGGAKITSAENEAFNRTKQRAIAAGLLPPVSQKDATPTPNPNTPYLNTYDTAANANTPTVTPTPSATVAAPGTNSAIVEQVKKDLIAKAQNSPELMKRLIAKGVVTSTPAATVTPTPSDEAIPSTTSSTQSTSNGIVSPPVAVQQVTPSTSKDKTEALVTPATPTPAVLKANVNKVYNQLPSGTKKRVDQGVVKAVIDEPLLQDLDPLYKAVAAVESGGNRYAKAVDKYGKTLSSAEGLFQLTSGAAADTKVNKGIPEQNVRGGVAYLNKMLHQFKDETVALMAYTGGAGLIEEAISRVNSTDREDIAFALSRMKANGEFEKNLAGDNLKNIINYPLKVQAYKEIFEALNYVTA